MEAQADLAKILKKGILDSELAYQRASIVYRKLGLMIAEFPDLDEKRIRLGKIIQAYQSLHWKDDDKITDQQVEESDLAELIAREERHFYQKRKEAIIGKLKEYKLTQQELGIVLGHTSKSYMSELVNGVSPFTLRDIIVLHHLLHIDLDYLIPTILSHEDRMKLKSSLAKINNPKLKLDLLTSASE